MRTRKPNSVPWIGVGVLAILLAGYAGAYYVKVQPAGGYATYTDGLQPEVKDWVREEDRWSGFFSPIHWLDRRLRPSYWVDGEPVGPRSPSALGGP